FYRFLMASIGLGAILAVKRKLPPLRIFRKPRWLVLLAIATCGQTFLPLLRRAKRPIGTRCVKAGDSYYRRRLPTRLIRKAGGEDV
ncbi:hypothetical protein MJM95_27960, partial [Salmonella enterica subsp. enterica serovar Anatum]|nr:hypothetical protein [Salmonella enterica subsp. enterica serovar Anatum]